MAIHFGQRLSDYSDLGRYTRFIDNLRPTIRSSIMLGPRDWYFVDARNEVVGNPIFDLLGMAGRDKGAFLLIDAPVDQYKDRKWIGMAKISKDKEPKEPIVTGFVKAFLETEQDSGELQNIRQLDLIDPENPDLIGALFYTVG